MNREQTKIIDSWQELSEAKSDRGFYLSISEDDGWIKSKVDAGYLRYLPTHIFTVTNVYATNLLQSHGFDVQINAVKLDIGVINNE